MGARFYVDQPLLKKQRAGEIVAVSVFAGCHSDDGESINSDMTDEIAIALLSGAISRRRRKALRPRRAAMYGSEVEGVWHDSLYDVHQDRPRLESSDHCSTQRNRKTSDHQPAQPPSNISRSSFGVVTRNNKKPNNPACGPCDNCGTSVSPQWRHGSKQKPTVCNACGIRYLRTGCFDKITSERKRNVNGGPVPRNLPDKGIRGERTPTTSIDTCPAEDMLDDITTGLVPVHGSRAHSKSPPSGQQVQAAAQPAAAALATIASSQVGQQRQQHRITTGMQPSATVTPYPGSASTSADDLSTASPGPFWLNTPAGASATASSSACIASRYAAQAGGSGFPPTQQQLLLPRSRATGHTAGRLGPSPLGRPGQAMALQVGAAAVFPSHSFSPAAWNQANYGQTRNMQPTVTTLPPTSGLINTTAARSLAPASLGAASTNKPALANVVATPETAATASTEAVVPALQPELLQLVSMLASRLGSVDAAIAFIKASRAAAASGSNVALRNTCSTPAHQ